MSHHRIESPALYFAGLALAAAAVFSGLLGAVGTAYRNLAPIDAEVLGVDAHGVVHLAGPATDVDLFRAAARSTHGIGAGAAALGEVHARVMQAASGSFFDGSERGPRALRTGVPGAAGSAIVHMHADQGALENLASISGLPWIYAPGTERSMLQRFIELHELAHVLVEPRIVPGLVGVRRELFGELVADTWAAVLLRQELGGEALPLLRAVADARAASAVLSSRYSHSTALALDWVTAMPQAEIDGMSEADAGRFARGVADALLPDRRTFAALEALQARVRHLVYHLPPAAIARCLRSAEGITLAQRAAALRAADAIDRLSVDSEASIAQLAAEIDVPATRRVYLDFANHLAASTAGDCQGVI